MLLFHYSALEYLPSILRNGIHVGEVPITRYQEDCRNAAWLTSDQHAGGHGLDGSRLDKRAVRITVKTPSGDRRLVWWPRYGKKRLEHGWYKTLHDTGGGKSRSWYLYFGVIQRDRFQSVTLLALISHTRAVHRG
jgi:hypothetical protein